MGTVRRREDGECGEKRNVRWKTVHDRRGKRSFTISSRHKEKKKHTRAVKMDEGKE